MAKVKVVLYCQACKGNDNDGVYGENRMTHRNLEKKADCEIQYQAFGGHLAGNNLQAFLAEAKTANVILLDAWTHAENFRSCEDAQNEMGRIARTIQGLNPEAVMFAQLMEGRHKVAVHKVSGVESFSDWEDQRIIEAIKWQNLKQENKERRNKQ